MFFLRHSFERALSPFVGCLDLAGDCAHSLFLTGTSLFSSLDNTVLICQTVQV